MTIYCGMLDNNHEPIEFTENELSRYVRSPCEQWADRYELHDGRTAWTAGFRGWFEEHSLQGGLRTITYPADQTTIG